MERLETNGVVYEPPGDVAVRPLLIGCYAFRRLDGNYDVYVSSSAPLKAIAKATGYRKANIDGTAHLVAYDEALEEAWRDSTILRQTVDGRMTGLVFQHHWETVLAPGQYVFTEEFETTDGRQRVIGAVDRLLVPYEELVELDISPLVIAADVGLIGESGLTGFQRNGREIVAKPGSTFKKGQDVCFYHEVYNLSSDTLGHCRYVVTYTIYDTDQDSNWILTSRTIVSEAPTTHQAGRIDGSKLKKGEFILEAKTEDLIANTKRVALASFYID